MSSNSIKFSILESIKSPELITNINKDEESYLINLFSTNNKLIQELDDLIDDIMNDGKIDYHDIPSIFLFVTKILKEYISHHKNIDVYNIIKFIVEIIIFKYDNISTVDIIIVDRMLNTSIDLLKESPTLIMSSWKLLPFCCCKKKIS